MSSKKMKAMNLQISKITIGNWTYVAKNPDDIVAKFYFVRKKLIWEFLYPDEKPRRLKRKIEMNWDDLSSFEEMIADQNEILKIELSRPPKFYIETNPQAGKQTQWKQMEEDLTGNQASIYRIHTLHFRPGVLQENLKKLLSDSFWFKLHRVRFPTQEAIHFNIDYGSNNNNTTNNFPSHTPLFYVNNDQLHHHSQGISGVGVEEGNFDMTTLSLADYGWQNSYIQPQPYSWDNTANEMFWTPAIPQLTQVINEPYNTPYMNISQMYPQVGPNLAHLQLEEDERQHSWEQSHLYPH